MSAITAMAPQPIGPALTKKGRREPLGATKAADAMHGRCEPCLAASEPRPARSDLLHYLYLPTYGGALWRRDLALVKQAAKGPGAARTRVARVLNSTPVLTDVSGCGINREECRT